MKELHQKSLKNNLFRFLLIWIVLAYTGSTMAQKIPADKVVPVNQLATYLKKDIKDILNNNGSLTEKSLADYFRQKFSERFFYDYKDVDYRFEEYESIYGNQGFHTDRAHDHMNKFAGKTLWKLPFNYLFGEKVDAYALRHLARQHKMVDIALLYHYDNSDPKYIKYFTDQMRSLNSALHSNEYETIEDGNGVYEVFRSGYRILNWLTIHNLFLNEDSYTDRDQLYTIATLLQHGEHLFQNNPQFRSGNHQTRGMSALAMLAILLRDFEGTELWLERAMIRLGEHLSKEINDDGFQFERSVHYHISDISNYFYVYQLAKINNIPIEKRWEEKLESLFTTLAKIAYPDRSAPVLQDDTDNPWGEKNDISGAMTLGYLLFQNPVYGYFAEGIVEDRMYWFISNDQLNNLKNIDRATPNYQSLMFPNTHYYIMREGWNKDDKMMIITAGLDQLKPDHQHGDMLGVQAMAYGKTILPNYQVRYSLKDLVKFKNSLVKNVALVDDQLQGKEWTSNKGGSGFGKFKDLPTPASIAWQSKDQFDLFIGSHDGFENIGVGYTRQVIFIEDDFWVVKDNFISEKPHDYHQVWQGHYSTENGPRLIRSSFDNGSGVDIFQLREVDKVKQDGARGKGWSTITKSSNQNYSFITALFPFKGYENRINEDFESPAIGGWKLNEIEWQIQGEESVSLSKEGKAYLFDVEEINYGLFTIRLSQEADLFISVENDNVEISLIGTEEVEIEIKGAEKGNKNLLTKSFHLLPGESWQGQLKF